MQESFQERTSRCNFPKAKGHEDPSLAKCLMNSFVKDFSNIQKSHCTVILFTNSFVTYLAGCNRNFGQCWPHGLCHVHCQLLSIDIFNLEILARPSFLEILASPILTVFCWFLRDIIKEFHLAGQYLFYQIYEGLGHTDTKKQTISTDAHFILRF